MKKVVSFFIAMIKLIISATYVGAASGSEILLNYAKKSHKVVGKEMTLSSSDRVKLERFLNDNPISEAEANSVISKAEEVIKTANDSGVNDISKLSKADKEKIIATANEAASILGVTLKFSNNNVEVYKDGQKIESLTLNSGKLAYTGNNASALALSGIAIIAVAMAFGIKKGKEKYAN